MIGMLLQIFATCKLIYDTVETVEGNVAMTTQLLDRVELVQTTCRSIEKEATPKRLRESIPMLRHLHQVLEGALEALNEYKGMWKITRVVKSGAFAQRFESAQHNIDRALLTLCAKGSAMEHSIEAELKKISEKHLRAVAEEQKSLASGQENANGKLDELLRARDSDSDKIELLQKQLEQNSAIMAEMGRMIAELFPTGNGNVSSLIQLLRKEHVPAYESEGDPRSPVTTAASVRPSARNRGVTKKPWHIQWATLAFEKDPDTGGKRILGRGGFATVFAATYFGKPVAVKVFPAEDVVGGGAVSTFATEVAALHRMRHPNIIAFHGGTVQQLSGNGSGQNGEFSLVMDRGALSLRKAMGAEQAADEGLGEPYFKDFVEDRLRIVRNVAAALDFLHESDPPVVHRDIKADNVMLMADGTARLVDFGLANVTATTLMTMATRATKSGPRNTSNPEVFGCTRQYAAPEVLTAKVPSGNPKQDIYSLGCLMYELAVNGTLWGPQDNLEDIVINSSDADLAARFRLDPDECGMPETYCTLVSRCTERDPSLRPSAQEIAAALSSTSDTATTPQKERELPQRLLDLVKDGVLAEDRTRLVVPRGYEKISDDIIIEAAEHCPQLQHLDVSWTQGNVTDTGILAVAQQCPQVRHLDLCGTKGFITDSAIHAVSQHCRYLQYLDVRVTDGMITDSGIVSIAQRCPQLQHIDVRVTKGKISDIGIVAVAQLCSQLNHLSVSNTDGMVTDASIMTVAKHCPHLQHLDVRVTEGKITDSGIVAVAQSCSQLLHLDVSVTEGSITDVGIIAIAEQCSDLQHLSVGNTSGKITDAAIVTLAESCPKIEHLDVSVTHGNITDAGIIAVAEKCSRLSHLGVSLTKGKITDVGILALAEHCSRLCYLDVSETDGAITEVATTKVSEATGAEIHV